MYTLTMKQCGLVSGGYTGQFDIPDPVVPNFNPGTPPLPDVNPPQPEPYWNWSFDLNLALGIPTPEPAKPKIGFP